MSKKLQLNDEMLKIKEYAKSCASLVELKLYAIKNPIKVENKERALKKYLSMLDCEFREESCFCA